MIPVGAAMPAWASVTLATAIMAVLVIAQRLRRASTTFQR
jgi:hypothetical protein